MRNARMSCARMTACALGCAFAWATAWSQAAEDPHEAFARRVSEEAAALERARAVWVQPAPAADRSPEQVLIDEVLVRREMARRQRVQEEAALKAAPAQPPAVPTGEKVNAAETWAAQERAQRAELRDERFAGRLNSAREHIETGRLDAARTALVTVLRDDPRNAEAVRLLGKVESESARRNAAETAQSMRAETAASMRAVDAARIPQAATLTYPRDWDEKTARAIARAVATTVATERPEDAAIRKALEKKISIDTVETALDDVAAYLRQVGGGLNIVVDQDVRTRRITLQLTDVRLGSVLDWVVKLTDLAYTVHDGCIHIGPAQKVALEPVVRVYDVSDILNVRQMLANRSKMLKGALGADTKEDPFDEVKMKTLAELADDMMEFLKDATGRKHWDDGGNVMNVRMNRLIVNAEPAMQEKIQGIIDNIGQ